MTFLKLRLWAVRGLAELLLALADLIGTSIQKPKQSITGLVFEVKHIAFVLSTATVRLGYLSLSSYAWCLAILPEPQFLCHFFSKSLLFFRAPFSTGYVGQSLRSKHQMLCFTRYKRERGEARCSGLSRRYASTLVLLCNDS